MDSKDKSLDLVLQYRIWILDVFEDRIRIRVDLWGLDLDPVFLDSRIRTYEGKGIIQKKYIYYWVLGLWREGEEEI